MSKVRAKKRHLAIRKAKKRKRKIKKLRQKLALAKTEQGRKLILDKMQALSVLPLAK
ncbi:MAG: hypothetical protein HY397_00475 [Candidatus Doudnabacteria bacterium]|nr:hypothetical protein [Candidatus Doudnabacteria bacterium]